MQDGINRGSTLQGSKQVIEEIIQVDQLDEQTVYSEITEYVATDRDQDHYKSLLKAIAESAIRASRRR